ncbi:fibrillar collagen [Ahrensia sp. R2A130]|nr:fibrillar collagen [Ahrensia sp. R2A130]
MFCPAAPDGARSFTNHIAVAGPSTGYGLPFPTGPSQPNFT